MAGGSGAPQRGAWAEQAVADALEADGWLILARNWRAAGGELDLVAGRGSALRFVEVKARPPGDDSGLDAIGPGKQRRLTRAAEAFLAQHRGRVAEVSFSVALLEGDQLRWLHDAFDAR